MSMVDISPAEQKMAGRIDAAITNSLVISDKAGGVQFTNAGQVTEFAKMLAVSTIGVRKHLRGNAGACLAIVVQAIEWAFLPMPSRTKAIWSTTRSRSSRS